MQATSSNSSLYASNVKFSTQNGKWMNTCTDVCKTLLVYRSRATESVLKIIGKMYK